MFDITKIAAMTAAEAIEQSRRVATAALSFVPHTETKDALAKAINLQCTVADIYAAQMDKSMTEIKKAWKFA
jgi:hypothetical protein